MFFRPAASVEAGRQAAFTSAASTFQRRLLLAALSAPLLLTQTAPARADQANDVFKKMADVYAKCKSFDGTIITKQTGKGPDGKSGSITTTQDVKYKSPNQFYVRLKASGTGAASKVGMEQLVVSDGKMFTEYAPARKEFRRRPAPPQVPFTGLLGLMRVAILPGQDTKGATLGPATTYQGHPAFVITVKPPENQLPPNMPAADKAKLSFQFTIDKQNFQLHKLVMNTGSGSQEIEFKRQSLNGSLPAGAFAFSPPPGAKEAKVPAPPQGGVPGAPGGPPR